MEFVSILCLGLLGFLSLSTRIVLQKQIADEEFPSLLCVLTSLLATEVFS